MKSLFCLFIPHVNFWMPEPILMKLSANIMFLDIIHIKQYDG
jgi:hypothetical protein